jgi:hypothetical protein
MDRELELLVGRATPLVFGVFSQIDNAEGERGYVLEVRGSSSHRSSKPCQLTVEMQSVD